MSIEIRQIRTYAIGGQERKVDRPFKPPLYVESVAELFKNIDHYVDKIPENERFNCYYSLGHKKNMEDKSRSWQWQEVIPFDIDSIDYLDGEPDPRYLEIFLKVTGIAKDKCAVVATGNGMQILVKPMNAISESTYFSLHKKFYAALLDKVFEEYSRQGLRAQKDVSAFEPNRLFRLPNTLNKKPDRPERVARIIQGDLQTDMAFDLIAASGLPNVSESEQVSEREIKYTKIDTEAVENGCEFLKWAKKEPGSVNEPQWYAMLSVVGRFDNGVEKAHEYSKGHPSYSARVVDQKLEQALKASGPRTCDNIQNLWGACNTCPHFKRITSPVQLKGESFIATRDSGFHRISKKGTLTPAVDDLYKYYVEKHAYVNVGGVHYIYTGSHYERTHDDFILQFAELNYYPKPGQNAANEFRAKIRRNHVESETFFSRDSLNKINLLNGVLDTRDMSIEKHSPSFGFTSTLDIKYDPIAECPKFDRFLSDVTEGDLERQELLLQYMGYAIANTDTLAQKALLLVGTGANGKSSFVQILRSLAGRSAVALSADQLHDKFDSFRLLGASLCVTEEMDRYMKDSWFERFKALVTGGEVTASLKGKDALTFPNRAKFVLTCNELPKGANPNQGFYRRLLIVPFTASFVEGKNLRRGIEQEIVREELSGVLNRALDAFQRLKASNYKFASSKVVEEALREYKLETDNVSRFLHEHVTPWDGEPVTELPKDASWLSLSPEGVPRASLPELRIVYEAWVKSQGEHAVSAKRFHLQLERYAADQGWGDSLKFFVAKFNGKATNCVSGLTYRDDSSEY